LNLILKTPFSKLVTGKINMRTDTRAGVIISYADDPNRIPCIFRKPAEIELLFGLVSGDEVLGHRQVRPDHFIHLRHDPIDLLFRKRPVKVVITLRFFLLNVRAETTTATQKPDHRLIEDVFRRVHPGVDFLFHQP
jgi:hypothetical protein